jgi:hypothetical protein
MKNNRLVLVFLAVFLLLAALLAYQESRPTQVDAPTPGERQAHVFPDLTLNSIQAIRLRSPETSESLILAREMGSAWTAPESSGTLNSTEADNIAKTMVLLPYNDTLAVKSNADLSAYGFTPNGVLSIQILLFNGDSHAVEVGYRNPTEDSYYALVDERPDLYLVERAAIDYLISRVKNPPIT